MKEEIGFDDYLDCRNLTCPMPVLKTRNAISKLSSGQVLKMAATDPGFIADIDYWSARTGNSLLKSELDGSAHIFFIQKN
ncbi:MAG: sulfurtransferase TusA family protein [SAR324 cluster bacterium]|nr:sulfurtransferase TusA family protein [SAR324 cluster bacterium]